MSISYTIRESLSGFTRTKLSSALSIITIWVSLLLLGVFALITIHAGRFVEEIRARVEIEAFLLEPIRQIEIDSLAALVATIEGVDGVVLITKEDAARIYKEETGEDIMNVLDYNPLPPSLRVTLKEGYKNASRARDIATRIEAINGIEKVTYRQALLETLDQRAATLNNVTLGLGILVGLSAIILVSNTIRLAIYAKRQIIRTMELVGATAGFIRLPFLLEGTLQGLIGGMLAAATLYAAVAFGVRWVSGELSAFIHVEPFFYLLIIAVGAFLGFVGSLISVARFIRPFGEK
jgi:cell division transport system permease protein